VTDALLRTWCTVAATRATLVHRTTGGTMGRGVGRCRGERGEGVISAAIAVLVMAFLGVAMWLAFQEIFGSAADKTNDQVDKIGS
jgi:hypothetical protein